MHVATVECPPLPSLPSPPSPRSDAPITVAIAAGGTGGHIYPGLALAAAVQQAHPDARILFVGTRFGMEGALVPPAGYPLHLVDMAPFARSAGWRRHVMPGILARAAWQCRNLLRREGVDVAVGMGGYPSLALVAGARLAGLPSLVHESNAVPGRANRLSAHLTPHVALGLSCASQWPPSAGAKVVGMPLSEAMRRFDRTLLRQGARARFGLDDATTFVVVSGGSQGSSRLDRAALELVRLWWGRTDVRVLVKASCQSEEDLRRQLERDGGSAIASVVPYLDRMEDVYAAADLMICRSGAATVAELARAGVASVLVPYPHAPGDHQTHNARALKEVGGAVVVPDGEATGPRWCALVDRLVSEPSRLVTMARAASRLGSGAGAGEDGAARLAAWVLELAQPDRRARPDRPVVATAGGVR